MAIEYLKRASRTPETESAHAREVAAAMLTDIETRGETAVREYAARLDGWHGDIVVSPEEIERRADEVPAAVRQDIEFATAGAALRPRAARVDSRIRRGASARTDGRSALVPINVARLLRADGTLCAYRVGVHEHRDGAKRPAVSTVIACSTPYKGGGIHPHVLYAMKVAGADVVMTLGGVQAIASLAFGLFTGRPADIVVGPATSSSPRRSGCCSARSASMSSPAIRDRGDRDGSADPAIVAADLVGQASTATNHQHGCSRRRAHSPTT
jgi:sulfopropanediol 3-dehydrogenase